MNYITIVVLLFLLCTVLRILYGAMRNGGRRGGSFLETCLLLAFVVILGYGLIQFMHYFGHMLGWMHHVQRQTAGE